MTEGLFIPELTYAPSDPHAEESPLLACLLSTADCANGGARLPACAGSARQVLAKGDFTGKRRDTLLLYPDGKGPERLLLIGLGETTDLEVEHFRALAGRAARRATALGMERMAIRLPDESGNDVVAAVTQGAVLGTVPGGWAKESTVKAIALHGGGGDSEAVRTGVALAEATLFARSLVDAPPNRLYPETLAEEARRIEGSSVSARILEGDALEREGLHALAAVGRGSDHPPRFVVLEYDGSNGDGPSITLIGKGITFDSGGLSLKSPDRMIHMKYDMAGAAAVLGAFRSAVRLELPVHLWAVVPSAENMPGGGAYRPGDIVSSFKGLTIEVDNTDAEGRLLLADGLAWAEKNLSPDEMIDMATLTGACRIALGAHAAGLFSNDDVFAARLSQAGRYSGERVWQLPLWEAYRNELESETADMKNVGKSGPGGGASVAAAFLGRFVESTPWAHLDIAGMAWTASGDDLRNKGASGFGAGLLLTYLMERSGRNRS